MREIYGIYEFTGNEVARILYEELIRRGKGKEFPDVVGINVTGSFGKNKTVIVQITDPIPGAKEI